MTGLRAPELDTLRVAGRRTSPPLNRPTRGAAASVLVPKTSPPLPGTVARSPAPDIDDHDERQ